MFDPDLFLDRIRDGCGRITAAREAGGVLQDVAEHCNGNPEYLNQIQFAELEAFEQIDKALFDAAVSGNVPAINAWIEYHAPDEKPDPTFALTNDERQRLTEEPSPGDEAD